MSDSPSPHAPEEDDVPDGSYAAGRRVPLPAGAEPPFTVFINGVARQEGTDYAIEPGEVVFTRPIIKEKVGGFRWLMMFLSVAGSYRKNETVDVQFQRDGRTELAADLSVLE